MPTLKVEPAPERDTLPFASSLELSARSLPRFGVAGCPQKPEESRAIKTDNPQQPTLRETFSDFALNVSSAHGLPNIFRAKTVLGRTVWTLIFLAGMGLALMQGTILVVNFFQYQVAVEVKIVTLPSLLFPSVTVCNTNKLRRSAVDKSRHRQMLTVNQVSSLPYYEPCVEGDFRCRDRPLCIKTYLLCDGIWQCGSSDHSDEGNCDYNFGSCADDQFRCNVSGSQWGLCIPETKRCDRKNDCYYGEDEYNCECNDLEFKCKEAGNFTLCIRKKYVCNGIPDCPLGSDEDYCDPSGSYPCDDTTFPCSEGGDCVPRAYVCDGIPNCPDASDESAFACDEVSSDGSPSPSSCSEMQFDCGDGQCVPLYFRCDVLIDCANGADEGEAECGRTLCNTFEVACANGVGCGYPCNLFSDCLDDSDERDCECRTAFGYSYAYNESDYVEAVKCSGTYTTNSSYHSYFNGYYVHCNKTQTIAASFFACAGGSVTCYEASTNIEQPCKTVYPECYTSPIGQDYLGKGTHWTCLPWSDDRVASLGYDGASYPELEGVERGSTVGHPFCRNPGGERPGPWCFAVDSMLGNNSVYVFDCVIGQPGPECPGTASSLSRRRRSAGNESIYATSFPLSSTGNYSNRFQCSSGEVIPFWQTCNQFPDCDDGSDEWNASCNDIVSECEVHEVKCREKDMCIPKAYICDGFYDCSLQSVTTLPSDEAACVEPGEPVPPNYFPCWNGHKMIHDYEVCNTVDNCYPNGEDEFACSWTNGTAGAAESPLKNQSWYLPYESLMDGGNSLSLFQEFESLYRERPFHRVKGEAPPDWNGFMAFSATPDYSDLTDVPKLSRDEVRRLGHQKSDFILQCAYDKTKCDLSKVTEFQDDTYGNCFTFNPRGDLNASKTGSRFGLQMTLFLEQSEYVSIYGQEAGVRVSVSPPHIRPNPTDNGFTVKPGSVTSIGLRYSYIDRKPQPYGECKREVDISPVMADGIIQDSNSSDPYDRGLCKRTCIHQHIIKYCGCSDTLELDYPRCRILDKEQDLCKQLMYFLFQNNHLSCKCPQQCGQVYYTKSTSTSAWPSKNFVKPLLRTLHSINNKTWHLNQYNILDNTVRLEVYYEELNYESTKEVPVYQSSALFGDIGGIIGLYVGFSVITVCEFFGVIVKLVKRAIHT